MIKDHLKRQTLEAFVKRHIKHGEYINILVNGNQIEHKINKIKNQLKMNLYYIFVANASLFTSVNKDTYSFLEFQNVRSEKSF